MFNFLVTLVDVLLFGAALFFLTKSSQIIIGALNALAKSSKVEIFALAGLFSAVATSLPELFVALNSAVAGKPAMILGVVFGSNVVNVTLVIGLVAITSGQLKVISDFVKKDLFKAFLTLLFPLFLLLDGKLSRIDGGLLLLVFFLYHSTVFHSKSEVIRNTLSKPAYSVGRWFHVVGNNYDQKQLGWFTLGIIMLLFSANIVVQTGSRIALDLHMPVLLIGFFLVAIGTSLPELVLEIKAVKNRQISMAFGNLLGALIANFTLILGLSSLVKPISLGAEQDSVFIAATVFLLGFGLLWLFVKTKLTLHRWEGLVLVSIYLLFMLIEYVLV